MNLQQHADRRKALLNAALPSSAGLARQAWHAAVMAASSGGKAAPAFTIEFGRSSFTIDTAGKMFSHDEEQPEKMHTLQSGSHIDTDLVVGSAPTNYMVGKFRVPCGIMLLVAGGSTGKTPLSHAIAGANGREYEVVRYGEPLAGYLSDERLGAAALAFAMYNNDTVVLDSAKDILALSSGGAMKSGLSRGALPLLSRWGALAASIGCTLIVPINPSSADDEVVDLLVEAAKSNATTAMFANSPDSWGYVSRRGEGLQREQGTIDIKYTDDGVLEITGSTGSDSFDDLGQANPRSTRSGPVIVTDDAYASAIRRSLRVIAEA